MNKIQWSGAALVALTFLQAAPGQTPPAGLFANTEKKNASASIAADRLGGYHLAYVDYVPLVENPRAVYMSCAPKTDCSTAAAWRRTPVGERVTEVQLALTPAAQPRMLLKVASQQKGFDEEYHYAECNAGCDKESSWTVTALRGTYGTSIYQLNDDGSPQRNFALDPEGRPRFVYIDRNYPIDPDHMGTYYMWCDKDCGNAANWSETLIADASQYGFEPVMYPTLAFTSKGMPRVVGDLTPTSSKNGDSFLSYFACDRDCGRRENWNRIMLLPRGMTADASWDLDLDAQDRPRVAFYIGALEGGGGEHLFYLWCDENCIDGNNWFFNDPGLGNKTGRHPDLELSAEGRPRIAFMYNNTSGLAYLWCDANCETDKPAWQAGMVETTATLEAEYPVARPTSCDASVWTTLTPVLALDPGGNPVIAYDAKYDTRCWYKDPARNDPPEYRYMPLWRVVRAIGFKQP